MATKDIIFINSHPIQYFAPLYKYLNEHGLATEAWYCSDETIKGGFDKQFGTHVKWDIPLLEGYKYKFFTNQSPKPSHFNGFFGLVNLSMIRELFRIPKSFIIVHGWHYFTLLSVLLLGKLRGHTICLRCELPKNQEIVKKGWKQKIKGLALRYLLFPRIHYFLFIGTQNKAFYLAHGIDEKRLLFCPYSVDNKRFSEEFAALKPNVNNLKRQLSILSDDKVILYAGKYIDKKRPIDVLKAFAQLKDPKCWLIMVGEGELRGEMTEYMNKHAIKNVLLTGFVNQSKISEYYSISDVFVMSSSAGETWGLSVNEAMNFDLPVVVSDLTGCANDLVIDGVNGFIYTTGNIEELSEKLGRVLNHELTYTESSKERVKKYSYDVIFKNLFELLN